MPIVDRDGTELLVIDAQARLLPAIDAGAERLQNIRRLVAAARRLDQLVRFTEQNPRGLGATVAELDRRPGEVLEKMTFDALGDGAVAEALSGGRTQVICGFEAHVCVLQTALGLLRQERKVFVVADAVGARTEANRQAALARLARNGVEIVTTEMVVFEWLGSAADPAFRDLSALIK